MMDSAATILSDSPPRILMSEIENENLLQLAGIYGLLGRLWYTEVDLDALKALSVVEFRTAFEELGGKVPNKIDADTVELLAVDYCQTFIGPKKHLAPIQSIWTEAKFQAECAGSMKNYFARLPGFEGPPSLPDHLGIQLNYMSEVFIQASQGKLPEPLPGLAEGFFRDHLSWTGRLLDKVEEKASTEFYRGLARLTRRFLVSEQSTKINQ